MRLKGVARALIWLVAVPAALLLAAVAIANRDPVVVDLWPLELRPALPLYLVVYGAALAGFVLGALVMWLAGGRTRSKARANYYRARTLERELAYLKRKTPSEDTGGPGTAVPEAPAIAGDGGARAR